MTDHEHDEDGNCVVPTGGATMMVDYGIPVWKFSIWDVVSVTIMGVGGVLSALSQAAHLLARECNAQANYSRQTFDLRESERLNTLARREMAADLNELMRESGGES